MTEAFAFTGDNYNKLDIFIPIPLDLFGPGIEDSIQNVIELHRRTGFGTFMLSGPSKGWRSIGYPPRDHFEQIAESILKFKEGVNDYDITVGWWNTMTLKTGPGPFQRIMNIDGQACPTSTCPLDAGFQERISQDVALVARRAEPAFIFFEDDFGLNCHNGFACFCDLHLQLFAERIGAAYSREALREIFASETDRSASLRREWAAISCSSLTQVAGRIRRAVDQVTAWMPMGSMQPGCADQDGNSTGPVAQALAGDRHRPFVRLYGTSYGSDDSFSLPENVFHALYCRQHLPEKFICYHESDTYPHNRFFMSAGKMRSLMGSVYSYGFAGSTFQACQALDNPNEETGYYEMFMAERKRFQAMATLARGCEISGCGLLCAPMKKNDWVAAFAHFGISYTTRQSRVNVLSGSLPDSFSDSELDALLQGGLLLDGEAAWHLCRRGFSAAIGVNVTGKTSIHEPGRDLGGRERIRGGFLRSKGDGRLMTCYATHSPYGNGNMYHLQVNEAATEIVTDLINFKEETVGIGMTRFRNAAGGCIIVMGMSVRGNRSSSLFNYRRGRLLQDLVVWAGATELVYVRNQPRVFCIWNCPHAACDDGLAGGVTLINLCSDIIDSVELSIPKTWIEATSVTCLDNAGEWREVRHEFLYQTVRLDHPMPLYQPLYLRFMKAKPVAQ